MSKAIIGLSDWGEMKAELAALGSVIDAGEELPEADYHLDFEDASHLFRELTQVRMHLLETLQATGASSIYALANTLGRNYSNVHSDVGRLLDLDLIEKDEGGRVFVPWESVQIQISLDGSHAEQRFWGEAVVL